MKVNRVDALILSSFEVEKTAMFYKGLGLDLVEEKHGEGPVHFACELGEIHFAIFESKKPGKSQPQDHGGATKFGLKVDDVDSFYRKAIELGAISKMTPDNAPWGRNAVVIDPDGRTLEFNGPL